MKQWDQDWLHVLDSFQQGDAAAFAQLSTWIKSQLARGRAFDCEYEWDDIAQEVIIAASNARRLGKLGDARAVVGFVRRTTRNKRVDRFRSRRREVLDGSPEIEFERGRNGFASNRGDGSAEEITRAFARLTENERCVLAEVYGQGFTLKETARLTGIPLGSVKRYVRQGLYRMGTLLDPQHARARRGRSRVHGAPPV